MGGTRLRPACSFNSTLANFSPSPREPPQIRIIVFIGKGQMLELRSEVQNRKAVLVGIWGTCLMPSIVFLTPKGVA